MEIQTRRCRGFMMAKLGNSFISLSPAFDLLSRQPPLWKNWWQLTQWLSDDPSHEFLMGIPRRLLIITVFIITLTYLPISSPTIGWDSSPLHFINSEHCYKWLWYFSGAVLFLTIKWISNICSSVQKSFLRFLFLINKKLTSILSAKTDTRSVTERRNSFQ